MINSFMKKLKLFFLKRFVKNESVTSDWGNIAYSIYCPFCEEKIAYIQLTAQWPNGLYELTRFYVYKKYARIGVGRYLLELAEQLIKQLEEVKIDAITVKPIGITDESLPNITKEERFTIYEHLGFLHTDSEQMIKKLP